ncbi:MAG: TIGR00725 family protein [Vulcanimicrobiota bacterium]
MNYFVMTYVGVIGAGECSEETARLAYETGVELARRKVILVCGGLGGVMEYACKGAVENGGTTIGILPMGDRLGQNPYLTYSIPTGLGEARNTLVVRACQALIAVEGSFGTLSEIAFALKLGRPVIGLNTWQLADSRGRTAPLILSDNPQQAVLLALKSIQ